MSASKTQYSIGAVGRTDVLVNTPDLTSHFINDPVSILAQLLASQEAMSLPSNGTFNLFCQRILQSQAPVASEKQMHEAYFQTLMSYRVLDIHSFIKDHQLRAPTTTGAMAQPRKVPVLPLNDVSSVIAGAIKDLTAHLWELREAEDDMDASAPLAINNPLLQLYSTLA
ncbi:hypothetical protein C0995_007277 [Termitomyces sp. Mi166|nr:hypothetical protein C0995_007277 [Termitomyces sp. Mi166\